MDLISRGCISCPIFKQQLAERDVRKSKWAAVLSIEIGLFIFLGMEFVQTDVKIWRNLGVLP